MSGMVRRHAAVHHGDDPPRVPGGIPGLERVHVHARHAGLPSTVWPVLSEAPELAEVGVVARRGPTLDRQVRLGPLHPVEVLEGARRGAGAPAQAQHLRRGAGVAWGAGSSRLAPATRFDAGAVLSGRSAPSRAPPAPVPRADAPAAATEQACKAAVAAARCAASRADRVERERTPLDQKPPQPFRRKVVFIADPQRAARVQQPHRGGVRVGTRIFTRPARRTLERVSCPDDPGPVPRGSACASGCPCPVPGR